MIRKIIWAILAVLGVFSSIALGLILKFTTYLSPGKYPRGITEAWYRDPVVCSSRIDSLFAFISHGGVYSFLMVSGKMLEFPEGSMPYFLRVENSPYRIAVDSPPRGGDQLYLIDDASNSMSRIETPGYNIASRFGGEICNPYNPDGVAANFDRNSGIIRITWAASKGMLVVDPVKRIVVDFKDDWATQPNPPPSANP